MDTYKLVKNYVLKRKFKVVEDADNHIIFRYQLENIHVCEDQQGDGFLMMVLPVLDNVTDRNIDVVVRCCNTVNTELKHVKIYVVKNLVLVVSEIFYLAKRDMEHQMNNALNSMICAKSRFESKFQE